MSINFKNIILFLLVIIIPIWLVFRNKDLTTNDDLIEQLHHQNDSLKLANDSLELKSKELDDSLLVIHTELKENETALLETQLQLNTLIKKKNEISNHVINLSANDVASELTKYIERHKTSKNTNK